LRVKVASVTPYFYPFKEIDSVLSAYLEIYIKMRKKNIIQHGANFFTLKRFIGANPPTPPPHSVEKELSLIIDGRKLRVPNWPEILGECWQG
jgi:hypothetical protein